MIEISNIDLSFGAHRIFSGARAAIRNSDKIGVVGANGAGKTTLLRILASETVPDSGEILKPKYATIGYLPQDGAALSDRPLAEEAESSFENIVLLRQRLADAEAIVASAPQESEEYADAVGQMCDIRQKLDDADESKVRPRVEAVLCGLGFSKSDMQRPCSEFSGGWRMRVALAKLLLGSPSLLMLDEPTNHLDIESIAWLEAYLANFRGAVLTVSHDRAFLNNTCSRIFHVTSGRIDTYTGNYDSFEAQAEARRQHAEHAAANQARMLEKTERFIERFRYKASKAAQVQSRIKMLEKIDRLEVERDDSKINFRFPPPRRCGQTVLKLEAVSKAFGGLRVLDNVNLRVERGQKIGVVGVNGAGKSTLSKIIAGQMKPDSGSVELGLNVELSFFAQDQSAQLNPNNDVLTEALEAASDERRPHARTLLGAFLFSGDDVFKKTSVLSGGEKNRLALAKILLKDFNFLLLDEPTNHLDMLSKKALQQALKSYEGTYMIVSHDRYFLDPLVDDIIELSPGRVRYFKGNLSDYVERVVREKYPVLRPSGASEDTQKERRRKRAALRESLYKLKARVREIEASIAQAEKSVADLELEMSAPDFFKRGAQCAEISEKYSSQKTLLDSLYSDWDKAQTELSEAENA